MRGLIVGVLSIVLSLSVVSCTSMAQTWPIPLPSHERYNAQHYIPANAVDAAHTEKKKAVVLTPPYQTHAMTTGFGFSDSPELEVAYKHYLKTGAEDSVRGKGFLTIAYDRYNSPILSCAPLQTCQIELEKNEQINAVTLGDTKRWMTSKIYVGKPNNGSWLLILKPTSMNIATTLTIATDRRAYHLRLVSRPGAKAPVVNFWYPKEMVQIVNQQAAMAQQKAAQDDQQVIAKSHRLDGTYVSLKSLNFNYVLAGDKPSWSPAQVFDDGNKTFIRLPPVVARTHLPILYVYRDHERQMVNYRYKRPYLIVDGLFAKAALLSGSGQHNVEVDIINRNIAWRR